VKTIEKLSVLLLLICVSIPASAQKLSKYYTSHYQSGGSLYFLHPNDEFRNTDDRSELHFDVTYLLNQDSVTVNFTTFSDKPQRADSIYFVYGNDTAGAPASQLFLDFEKRKWRNRYSAVIPYKMFTSFIHASTPPHILVSSHGHFNHYAIKHRHWNKYADALKKVIHIIGSDL
jgi:hypothetical protein